MTITATADKLETEYNRERLLIETRLEERDGATWVSGICPLCWDRFAFPAPAAGSVVRVPCPGGHPLRIEDQRSAGTRPWGRPEL